MTTLNRITAALALTLAATLPMGAAAQGKEALKLGVVTSQTGVFQAFGEDLLRGVQFAVDEANANGGVAGRPVQVQIADDEGTPDAGRRAAERLANGGHNLLIGPISSAVSLAIAPNLERWDAIYVATNSKSDRINGDACKARMFRTIQSDAMDLAIVRPWLEKEKEKRFGIIAGDYVWGRGAAEAFTKAATSLGRKVEVTVYPPLGTKDFAPYISQLKTAGTEGVFVALTGRDQIAFVKQAEEFGLSKSVRIIGLNYLLEFALKATGTSMEGAWGNINYNASIQTARNQQFVDAWRKKYNRDPSEMEGGAYTGATTIFQGVQKAGSVKPADVAKALRGASLETVFGTVTMRAQDNQLQIPNYFGIAKLVNGQLRSSVTQTFDTKTVTVPASADCKL
ncbi:MAG: ABC transporter substrate-binding protein [Polaromonas sp.]|uniref:ABC transporter substrate-binding protein n=1 Tax=Polaromonas sp. TaxID=1869339 RepID=UPI002487DE03|nr:ABC transporter substrate-binding protein [Polaromonas sp.]MDI1239985.1 ABC transporter substrate-binding protein [Polaromonas sp.]